MRSAARLRGAGHADQCRVGGRDHRMARPPSDCDRARMLRKLRIDRRDLEIRPADSAAHFAALLDFGAAQTRDVCFGLHRGGELRLEKGWRCSLTWRPAPKRWAKPMSYHAALRRSCATASPSSASARRCEHRLLLHVADARMGAVPASRASSRWRATVRRAAHRHRRAAASARRCSSRSPRGPAVECPAVVRLRGRFRRARRRDPAVDGHARPAHPDGG